MEPAKAVKDDIFSFLGRSLSGQRHKLLLQTLAKVILRNVGLLSDDEHRKIKDHRSQDSSSVTHQCLCNI